jgi:hypothetical protein
MSLIFWAENRSMNSGFDAGLFAQSPADARP